MSTPVPTVAKAIRRRLHPLVRGSVRRVGKVVRPAVAELGRIPLPYGARVALSKAFLRKPGLVEVPLDKVLLGAQDGVLPRVYADRFDDLLWASTPVTRGPHRHLLALADRGPLDDADILESPYGEHAKRCLTLTGRYFWATDEAGIVDVARNFLARAAGGPRQPSRSGQSGPDDPILVAPIRDSECFQLVDGHHRAALAAHAGAATVRVSVKRVPVTTPLQDLLNEMSWIGGRRELYQPIDAPELVPGWTVVRRCTDRLGKMRTFLAERGVRGDGRATYLDVASCYGWFVHHMGELGFAVEGIERDPLARRLGRAVYGVPPDRIRTGDAAAILAELATRGERRDVVSCFSLLHHFVLGRGSVGADELVRRLAAVTGRVLFLDTGQGHEAWFARSLAGWNPDYIRRFLLDHGGFDEVVDLGPDADAVGPYAGNYGRHLFACVRT